MPGTRSLTLVAGALLAAFSLGAAQPTGTLVVTNKSPSTATIIDVGSNRILATLPTGPGPHEVAISSDGRLAIVTNYGGEPRRTLTVIDVPALRVTRTIELGQYTAPHGIVFLPGDSLVAVTSETTRNLVVVNVLAGAIRKVIATEEAGSHMVGVTGDGARAYTGNIGGNNVSELDLVAGRTTRRFAVPAQPEAINVTPDGKEVWVGSNATGTVSVVDPATGTATAAAEGFGWPYRVLFSPDTRTVLLPDLRREELRFVERASRRELARLAFPGGGPQGIAITPDGRWVFQSLSRQGRVAIVDAGTRTVAGYLASGETPDGVVYTSRVVARGAAPSQGASPDSLDAFIRTQMARRQIRGLSLAIIQDGKIVVARGYGITDDQSRAPVTTATLFQAGSISKPVAALGALHLVEAGRLSLDENVNDRLTTWKVPENRFTAIEKVTLRRLLSHSAGLTVHGFPGYDAAEPVPSTVQVLDGVPPTNTPAIRVDTTPGAIWRYSGGGYTVMQQLVVDVSGNAFPEFMRETVLAPIGMSSSSYEQPQPAPRSALTAAGYYNDRSPVRGRWHLYPEMAAAGLWTTASDLARFAIEIQETLAGKGHGVISPAMARQYVTRQKGNSGLGIGVNGADRALSFSHGGRDEGFDAQLFAFAETGQGVAILINANDNSRFMGRLLDFIGRSYGWPAPAAAPTVTTGATVAAALLAEYAGYYELAENQMTTLVPSDDGAGLDRLSDGLPDEVFLAIDSTRFGSAERALPLTFTRNARGEVDGVLWGIRGRISRLVPLPGSASPTPDPNPAQTARIRAALAALVKGGPALTDAAELTPGARKDFSGGTDRALAGLKVGDYLGEANVAGRGIRRHGHEVATVRYYRVTTAAGARFLLAHLAADGAVTDYDIVTR